MAKRNEDLVLEIKRVQDNIRQKHRMLKNSLIQSRRSFETQFKPLIEPLKKLSGKVEDVKKEVKEEDLKEESFEPIERDVESSEDIRSEYSESHLCESDCSNFSDNNPLERYLKFISEDTNHEADFTYGITYDGQGWRMGPYEVTFTGNDLKIGDITYKGTHGLFELIFKKQPANVYTDQDLKTYELILRQTRAYEKEDGKVKSNKGYKYTNIISKLFPPKRRYVTKDLLRRLTPTRPLKRNVSDTEVRLEPSITRATSSPGILQQKRIKLGEGLEFMRLNSHKVDYRYWDDPNELCERLRLLLASKAAGNTGVDNEIKYILEELMEARIIKDYEDLSI